MSRPRAVCVAVSLALAFAACAGNERPNEGPVDRANGQESFSFEGGASLTGGSAGGAAGDAKFDGGPGLDNALRGDAAAGAEGRRDAAATGTRADAGSSSNSSASSD